MQYSEGRIGRVFVLRIDDGEDFLGVTREFVKTHAVTAGTILYLGALRQAKMVTGPEEAVFPPDPHFVMFEGGWEMVGIGTITMEDGSPAIHFHTSVGRAGHALTGCLREKAVTYIVAEAVILEFSGISIVRQFDEKTQVNLPVHGQDGEAQEKSAKSGPTPPEPEPAEEEEDAPGGLADIIRDLTRRPPVK
ncbi:PPC domain-containing DNA-binding protein [Methanoregula sp. UBA64]|uniref:PPC domain-containing DNA-binding protein n=1 Tax=Methanoregula sp. UBA64 TaxID=1915554 RepID=UPI0025D633D8|nr:PPC domain-containing DNA-binding protein [Methanoregula sp. UBA64]